MWPNIKVQIFRTYCHSYKINYVKFTLIMFASPNIDNRSVQQTISFLDIQGNVKRFLNLCCIFNSTCLKNIFVNILVTKVYINAKVTANCITLFWPYT